MTKPRPPVAVAAILLLLAGCSWTENVMTDDASAPSLPPASASLASTAAGAPARLALTGAVQDTEGDPVNGALVRAVSLDTPVKSVPEIAVLTDRSGRYRWPAVLPPGRYRLEVRTAIGTATKTVTVRPETTATANLTIGR